jgi:hypothetical protein
MDPYQYRNPDGSLRLDELLGDRYVRHYTRVLASSSDQFAAMQLAAEMPPPAGPEARPSPLPGLAVDGWCLVAEGAAEREASSCTDVAVMPEACWDVCGYYRRLGLHWRASRKDVRLAYLALDPMKEDEGLHYAMTQLLDPVIRRAYDLMPLGGLFLGDRGVRESIERAAAMEASRRTARMGPGDMTDQAEVLSEWGFDKGVPEAEARERLSGQFRAGTSSDELGASLGDWERHWGWYRLADPYDNPYDVPDDGERLERWQSLLSAALSAMGIRIRFSVGTWPGNGVRHWRDGNKSCIFFIGGQATEQAAQEAVRACLAKR